MKELKVYVPQDGPYGLEPEEGGEPVEEETCYLKSEVDAAIAELKSALKESEEARYEAGADAADYYQETRRLKRALWLARAERADDRARIFYFNDLETMLDIDGFSYDSKKKKGHKKLTARDWRITWLKVECKCRSKAEEYK